MGFNSHRLGTHKVLLPIEWGPNGSRFPSNWDPGGPKSSLIGTSRYQSPRDRNPIWLMALRWAGRGWQPSRGPQSIGGVCQVTSSNFVNPNRFELGGFVPEGSTVDLANLGGSRHTWNCLVGEVAAEVLEWLRADPVFDHTSEEYKAMGVKFTGKGETVKTEDGRKWICAGAMGRCGSKRMCALKLDPFPSKRVLAWFCAWRAANEVTLKAMAASCIKAAKELSEEDFGKNGEQLVETPWADWLLSCGEMAISFVGDAASGY